MKYKTDELVEQLEIRGGYPYVAGYLASFIEMLPHTVKLTAKQEKAMREAIEDCIAGLRIQNRT